MNKENPCYYLEPVIGKHKSFLFIKELSKISSNEKIDTKLLANLLELSSVEIFKAMIILKEQEIVESYHELTCPRCKFKKSFLYKHTIGYSKGVPCDTCSKELTVKNARYVFLKKGEN